MRIQARIIMPDVHGAEAVGYWPAFWSLGASYRSTYWNWPGVGEFDIMENVNGLDRVWGVFHCGVNPGGPCQETDGLAGNRQCPGTACQGNVYSPSFSPPFFIPDPNTQLTSRKWHTYTIEVDRTTPVETLKWYVDEILFHTVTEAQVGTETWNQATHQGHFILVNLAIGGAFPNNRYGAYTPIASTVDSRPMYVDYVAVYNS